MNAELQVVPVDVTLTYPLRKSVLRPSHPSDAVELPDDKAGGSQHFGAYANDTLVGIASVMQEAPELALGEGPWMRLRGMAVHPEARSTGVGSALLRAVHGAVPDGGRLWCNARTTARGFYRKLGLLSAGPEFDIPGIGPHVVMHSPKVDDLSWQWIQKLRLQGHPEGGYYRQTYASEDRVVHPLHGKSRPACTQIYFLLSPGHFSAWHRVVSDEIWHHYSGGPLELLQLTPQGRLKVHHLSGDISEGAVPHEVIPAGRYQAARPAGNRACLVGCTVAPGFDFADLAMPTAAALVADYPQHEAVIRELTRQ